MSSQFNYKSYSIAALRRASYRTPMRNIALQRARVSRGIYECAHCKKHFNRKFVQVDHIIPIVDPLTGWVNLDHFAERLFCPVEGLQVLCLVDHKEKTASERIVRKDNNTLKHKKKKDVS